MVAEKAKFYLAKTKLKKNTLLNMIISRWSLSKLFTSGLNEKEIGDTSCETFAFARQFSGLIQGMISKIF